MPQDWIEVCALEDIPVLGSRKLLVGTLTLALIRAGEDRVYALEDRCPHKGGPFSEGIVAADRVACPLHGQCVDLATGAMVSPDEGRVQTYAVRLDAGRVYLSRGELRAASAHPPLSCAA